MVAKELDDMPTFPEDDHADDRQDRSSPEHKYLRTEDGKGNNSGGKGVAGMAARAAGAVGSALFRGRGDSQCTPGASPAGAHRDPAQHLPQQPQYDDDYIRH
eukprot:287994-Pyramimonas_sp.AAC.1